MITKGTRVRIKDEVRDKDDIFERIALEDEDGGRVLLQVSIPNWVVLPSQIEWVKDLEIITEEKQQ